VSDERESDIAAVRNWMAIREAPSKAAREVAAIITQPWVDGWHVNNEVVTVVFARGLSAEVDVGLCADPLDKIHSRACYALRHELRAENRHPDAIRMAIDELMALERGDDQ
jgi:hypothetical protein